MESSKRESTASGSQSLSGLLEAASGRVQEIIQAAETSAAGILEDAKSEARRYADEARERVDTVSRERTQRVAALTDELSTLGEELIRQAESMRSQAQALAGALGRAANEIYSDLEEQEAALDGLAPEEEDEDEDEEDEGGLIEPDLGAEFEDLGLEPDGPRFAEERTLALEEDPDPDAPTEPVASHENGAGERRRGIWRGFRRRDEPGTAELAVIDEVAEEEELADHEELEPDTDDAPEAAEKDGSN